MNTKILYLYRDASNYKAHNEAILAGEMTREHVRRITARMNDEYFIPRDVGLPEQRITDYRTDDDHCWFEWELGESDDGELYGFELTDETPTINMTVDELAQRFEAVQKWDETSWMENYEYRSYDELYGSDDETPEENSEHKEAQYEQRNDNR